MLHGLAFPISACHDFFFLEKPVFRGGGLHGAPPAPPNDYKRTVFLHYRAATSICFPSSSSGKIDYLFPTFEEPCFGERNKGIPLVHFSDLARSSLLPFSSPTPSDISACVQTPAEADISPTKKGVLGLSRTAVKACGIVGKSTHGFLSEKKGFFLFSGKTG